MHLNVTTLILHLNGGSNASEFLEQVNNGTIDVTYCENEKRQVQK